MHSGGGSAALLPVGHLLMEQCLRHPAGSAGPINAPQSATPLDSSEHWNWMGYEVQIVNWIQNGPEISELKNGTERNYTEALEPATILQTKNNDLSPL